MKIFVANEEAIISLENILSIEKQSYTGSYRLHFKYQDGREEWTPNANSRTLQEVWFQQCIEILRAD